MKRTTSQFTKESKETFLQIPYPLIAKIYPYLPLKYKLLLYITRMTCGFTKGKGKVKACYQLPKAKEVPDLLKVNIKKVDQTFSAIRKELKAEGLIFEQKQGRKIWVMINPYGNLKQEKVDKWEFSQDLIIDNKGNITSTNKKEIRGLQEALKKVQIEIHGKLTERDKGGSYKFAEKIYSFVRETKDRIFEEDGEYPSNEDFAHDLIEFYDKKWNTPKKENPPNFGNYQSDWFIERWEEHVENPEEDEEEDD